MFDAIFRRDSRPHRAGAKLALLALLACASALLVHASPRNAPAPPPPDPQPTAGAPRIEAVFVLDTTGSMSGLIEGAKQKIWSIASQMANANTTPDIRMGLIAYRDRGDAYVTQRFDLSRDIDALWQRLQSLRADGGGDGPESVNQALHEAVAGMGWSDDPSVYRVVFLVGDAPPHMDYLNDVPYAGSVRLASARGIAVNTIQCGSDPQAAAVWREIAGLGQGTFVAIAQDGAMVASTTPMDEELARLNAELSETVVTWGAEEEQRDLAARLERAEAAAPSTTASRLAYLARKGGGVSAGRSDLVDAVTREGVELGALSEEELPEPMRAMDADERQRYVAGMAERRKEVRQRIDALVDERDRYLAAEAEKRRAAGKDDAFDDKVLEAIREQAAEKGILY